MKSRTDEEDFWNSTKFKPFTFDDDDDGFSRVRAEPRPHAGLCHMRLLVQCPVCSLTGPYITFCGSAPDPTWSVCVFQLKESKQAVNNIRSLVDEEEDEGDVEKVSWSGEPVGSKKR